MPGNMNGRQRLAGAMMGGPQQLGAMGRGGDTQVGHLTPGEVVVPQNVLAQGDTRGQLAQGFEQAGAPMGRYEVGGMDDSINPVTGMREYWGVGDGSGGGIGDSPGSVGGDAGGDSPGYSGPGPGEMGASPSLSFSGQSGGDYGGFSPAPAIASRSRAASFPSRAGQGGGYHGAGGAIAGGYSGMGPDYGGGGQGIGGMLGKTMGKFGTKGIASLIGSMTGIPGLGLLAGLEPYDAAAKAHNISQMQAGKPHHNPETGVWSMAPTGTGTMSDLKDHMTLLNPESWHAGPVPAMVSGGPSGSSEGAQATAQAQPVQAIQQAAKKRDEYQALIDALLGKTDESSLTDPFAGIG